MTSHHVKTFEKTILGIDPGLGRCGFGVIHVEKNQAKFIDCGVIETKQGNPLPERLSELRQDFLTLLEKFKPDLVAIEELFFTKNITTGIAVASARGIILEAAHNQKFPIMEIKPQDVKMAVTGVGNADKIQIQEMTTQILKLSQKPRPDDAADALAITLAVQNRLDDFKQRLS